MNKRLQGTLAGGGGGEPLLAQPLENVIDKPSERQPMTAEELISQAIQNKTPVEVMEKLLALHREIKADKAKEVFDQAMSNFQSECPTIVKTKEVRTSGGVVAYRYAPIESIVEQVKMYLKANGFSYSTNMELLEGGSIVKVSIKVTHAAGHSEVTEMTVPLGTKTGVMSQTQVVAAAQTFAKRYAFCNAFGILTGDEDTDARPETQPAPGYHQTEASEDGIAKKNEVVQGSKCSECGMENLPQRVIDFSKEKYGKVLCYRCQQQYK